MLRVTFHPNDSPLKKLDLRPPPPAPRPLRVPGLLRPLSIWHQLDDVYEARPVVSRGRAGLREGVQGVKARPRLAHP